MDPVCTATGHGPCERSVLAKVLAEQGVLPAATKKSMSTRCQDVFSRAISLKSYGNHLATLHAHLVSFLL